ncbi:amino acid ABC transporter substrate-binding protein [Amylibacter ulvae]|uniref:Amino acid ABC transporter substrate-binding protein n=1 Tax=Paramylibacter ulvae TaxID=1651968 RepID=A0ABQ3CSW7_9RHOB|nr:transporter substrate-binding domain-containing protein [Amylibacter ulvae]GHA42500.1 amino acid ABC transporter substrate-binding protein [Amylibacter ulvae]
MRCCLAALAFLIAPPTFAQNCEGVKSGLEAYGKPQNTARDIVGQSLDDIIERGWMMFAVYEDYAPYSWMKDGSLVGIDVDLGRLIAQDLGVEARFFQTAADENVDADLRNNVWRGKLISGQIANVMMHVPYDHELGCRNEQVVLTGQYFNEKIAIAYRDDVYPDGGPTPAYFRYDKVGVENDTLADFYLASIANGLMVPNMVRFDHIDDAMAALRDKQVAAVTGPIGQLEHGLVDGLSVHQPPLVGLAKSQWTLGVAVRHNWRPLGYTVDDAIRAAVNDGRMADIFASYGLQFNPPEW